MSRLAEFWPLYGLRVSTGDVELRYPGESDLAELAALAYDGVHDPAAMPFSQPWTDCAPEERARSVLQWNWKMRAEWRADSWHLPLVTLLDGRVVGTQGVEGANFPTTREVQTGSWIGLEHQGAGIGTAMRRAVLHFAFAGLGAESARSGAFADNATSLRVSEKLGYVQDGTETHERRGERATIVRLILPRERWEKLSASWPEVRIDGLEPALGLFGLGADEVTEGERRDTGGSPSASA